MAETQNDSPKIRLLHVKAHLPQRLEKLRELAYNLRWSWEQDAIEIFRRVDRELWGRVGHNPVRLLGSVDQARLETLQNDAAFLAHLDQAHASLQEHLDGETWFSRTYPDHRDLTIAYFSAEFGITEAVPFYSGGLGVLAGDHLKSASALGVPLVGVGLAYQEGYFVQNLNIDGWQQETYRRQNLFDLPLSLQTDAEGEEIRISVKFPGREVGARIWVARVGRIRLYLLDTNIPENAPGDRAITARLYGGTVETRIQQEIVLGIGGLRALEKLGIRPDVCHMNEGHAAFLGVERARVLMTETGLNYDEARELAAVSCLFTTHTPVPAGFDLFETDLVRKYFGEYIQDLGLDFDAFMDLGRVDPGRSDQAFNMALCAVRHSTYRNGVSRLHDEVSRRMMQPWWPGYPEDEIPVESITNGTHLRSWISRDMKRLLDGYLGPFWADDPTDDSLWEPVTQIPEEELWRVHMSGKQRLVTFVRRRLESQLRERGGSPEEIIAAKGVLDPDKLIIGFARRFATYKRATLLFRDLERLKRIILSAKAPVQFVFAGKAHPADSYGKEIIKRIVHFAQTPELRASMVFLENYDINVARHLVQGVDVWLNTPRRPLEASGTSGMKAAANGTLNLSVLDGWWCEAYDNRVGWSIGHGEVYENEDYQDNVEANALYDILEREVVPVYYDRGRDGLPSGWITKMRASMRRICPRFNTNRMVGEYADRFYVPAARRAGEFANGNHHRIRDLVGWIRNVQAHWGEVAIPELDQPNGLELQVGARVPIRARVVLGELKPSDVSVELYHGEADAEGRIPHGNVTPLVPEGEVSDGSVWYRGDLTCPVSGLYGYAVRVRPAHPDAMVPHRVALITWY